MMRSFQVENGKRSRMQTGYKMRVGDIREKPIGRYTPYSKILIPPTENFKHEDGERYYRHAKVSALY